MTHNMSFSDEEFNDMELHFFDKIMEKTASCHNNKNTPPLTSSKQQLKNECVEDLDISSVPGKGSNQKCVIEIPDDSDEDVICL